MLLVAADSCVRRERHTLALSFTQLRSVDCALVNTGKAWIVYILLRIVFFAVPFAVLFLIGWPWWLALAIATLVALALSIIFLSNQRNTASNSIYEWRMRERTADDIVEDDAVDAAEAAAPGVANEAPENETR